MEASVSGSAHPDPDGSLKDRRCKGTFEDDDALVGSLAPSNAAANIAVAAAANIAAAMGLGIVDFRLYSNLFPSLPVPAALTSQGQRRSIDPEVGPNSIEGEPDFRGQGQEEAEDDVDVDDAKDSPHGG